MIDCIASHHIPQDKDHKVVEFEYAKNGMINLQTTYAILNTTLPEVPQERWVELLAINARRILNIPVPTIAENSEASLTLFLPKEDWVFELSNVLSFSKNTPFVGKQFTGKPLGIYHKNKLTLNQS
ncbi:hypothetical protein [Niabella ginsengisoli]|uniref:Uncharacterized protein n=1 Tax=Niabella ginsengisoli TaxID=522298 RepID=A0ABS9SG27_9BACT|nr:hypothetical protein [Niabella ginsengisoli]MCH5597313.1 hypothetical protein [Niabella ginsengisoli]